MSRTFTAELVEVSDVNALVQLVGLYSHCNVLYAVNAPNTKPVYVGPLGWLGFTPLPTQLPPAAPAGISDWTLLRAIAVAQNPDLIMRLQP